MELVQDKTRSTWKRLYIFGIHFEFKRGFMVEQRTPSHLIQGAWSSVFSLSESWRLTCQQYFRYVGRDPTHILTNNKTRITLVGTIRRWHKTTIRGTFTRSDLPHSFISSSANKIFQTCHSMGTYTIYMFTSLPERGCEQAASGHWPPLI